MKFSKLSAASLLSLPFNILKSDFRLNFRRVGTLLCRGWGGGGVLVRHQATTGRINCYVCPKRHTMHPPFHQSIIHTQCQGRGLVLYDVAYIKCKCCLLFFLIQKTDSWDTAASFSVGDFFVRQRFSRNVRKFSIKSSLAVTSLFMC